MEDHKDAQRVTMGLCNVSTATGRVLQLIAMAVGGSGEGATQNVVLMRDSGMSCVFAGYSSKKRDGW